MSEIVLKEYENKRIHHVGVNSYKGARSILESISCEAEEQVYCDTTPVELECHELKRVIDFKDIPYREGLYSFDLGENNSIKIEYIRNSYISDLSFDETLALFNIFNLNDFKLTDMTTQLNINDNSNYYCIRHKNIFFKVTDIIKSEDKKTVSGKLTIIFKYYKCPKCGELLMSDYIFTSKTNIQGIYLYDDEDHIKISYLYKQVVANSKFAWNRYYKDMLIFKKATRKIYEIKNFNYAGSKYLKDKNKKTIKEITYSCSKILNPEYFFNNEKERHLLIGNKKFFELVSSYLEETDQDLYRYTKSDIDALNYSYKNEYIYFLNIKKKYNINNTLLAKLIFYARKEIPKTHSIIKDMTEKEIMNYYKVNTKRLKKIEENDCYIMYLLLFDLIDDVNNLNYLIGKVSEYSIKRYSAKYKDFLYQYRKNNTEKRFINQIINNISNYYINDTCNLFQKIRSKIKDYNVDYSRSILDLHDIFSRDFNKLKNKNREIESCKELVKVFKDIKINDTTYRMPNETDELIRVGAFMDICVGSYGDRAVNKECYIVVGYNSDDKPVTCIEFRKEKKTFTVHQVKKRKNFTAKDSEVKALKSLFKKNNIKTATEDLSDDRYRKLEENDSEILGKREKFTFAVNVPYEMRQELIGQAI